MNGESAKYAVMIVSIMFSIFSNSCSSFQLKTKSRLFVVKYMQVYLVRLTFSSTRFATCYSLPLTHSLYGLSINL